MTPEVRVARRSKPSPADFEAIGSTVATSGSPERQPSPLGDRRRHVSSDDHRSDDAGGADRQRLLLRRKWGLWEAAGAAGPNCAQVGGSIPSSPHIGSTDSLNQDKTVLSCRPEKVRGARIPLGNNNRTGSAIAGNAERNRSLRSSQGRPKATWAGRRSCSYSTQQR